MQKYIIIEKKLILFFVLILFLFSNFSNITFANSNGLIEDLNDGVWHTDFSYYSIINDAVANKSIESYSNCVMSNGKVILSSGETSFSYNYNNTPSRVEAWKIDSILIQPSDESLKGILSQLIRPELILGKQFTFENYSNIAKDDGKYTRTTSTKIPYIDTSNYPINRFRFNLNTDLDNVDKIGVKWKFGTYFDNINLKEIKMFVYRYDMPLLNHWDPVASIEYDEEIIDQNQYDLDFVYTSNFPVSDNGFFDVLIVGIPDEDYRSSSLHSDFITVDVKFEEGYLKEGYIITPSIPSNTQQFYGWEKIYWSGRTSSDTSIKIRVLFENTSVIQKIEGNSEGFTDSIIDLSSLGVNPNKIKLQVFLNSNSFDSTPMLESLTVLWQPKPGFYDSFTSDYRIKDKIGVELDDGQIKISEFLTDWPMLGKTPDNTRSYSTFLDVKFNSNLYWYTLNRNMIGGGFRSPVIYAGKVYIAGADNRVYVISKKNVNNYLEQDYISRTDPLYKIDNSLAVTEKYIIFGTSDIQSNNNRIYALNRSEPSNVMWSYPTDGNNDYICFSSAPTINNGRVYITSWGARFADNLLLYNFNRIFNELTNYRYSNREDKLIVIDTDTGELIWDNNRPIIIPGPSFSAPAVSNGLIIIGCDNLHGKSLIAYDEETREEVWSANIGSVGRCSPVVYNDKVFCISRKQSSLASIYGNDEVYAFSTEGEKLWNFTLSQNTTLIPNLVFFDIDNKLLTSSPISSPTVWNDTLFIINPQGELFAIDIYTGDLKWNYTVVDLPSINTYNSASPIVIDGVVFVVTEWGRIKALNAESSQPELLWQHIIENPDYGEFQVPYLVYASPVISDNLIFVSLIEKIRALNQSTSSVYCIGSFSRNKAGIIISQPIHVPKGNWWLKFNTTDITTSQNKIIYSILDRNEDIIPGYNNIDGNNTSLNNLSDNIIHLCARLELIDATEDEPILDSWEISWQPEAAAPQFDEASFTPGKQGWINEDVTEFSIEVRDIADNQTRSGLDTTSARFNLVYKPTESSSNISGSYIAECDNELGSNQTTIRANISRIGIKATQIERIYFSIKDLASNLAKSSPVELKLDNTKPSSEIDEKDEFLDSYNKSILIYSNANDEGGSGISILTLYYQYSEDGTQFNNWTSFGNPINEFEDYLWTFGKDPVSQEVLDSGYYRILTIAEDKAGNKEEITSKDSSEYVIDFFFDMKIPVLNDLSGTYRHINIPTFKIEVTDDYMLNSLEFRIDDEINWKTIKEDISDTIYSINWNLPVDIWEEYDIEDPHYIIFRVTDSVFNTYESDILDSPLLIKDENITKFKLLLTDFDGIQWDDQFDIKIKIPEIIEIQTIKLFYRYSENDKKLDNNDWILYGENITQEPFIWSFNAKKGNGYYEFKSEIIDVNGVIYITQPQKIQVMIIPHLQLVVFIILILIFFIVTYLIVLKMKKIRTTR
jgi:outer membrane protein assembly factor BamB